jgi:hypothetical protein
MTIEACQATCSTRGFKYAGTEGGNECYCANTILSTATKQPSNQCTSNCVGNTKQKCGGSWRLSIYQAVPSNSTSGSGNSTTSGTCFQDVSVLNGQSYTSNYMSAGYCVAWCKGKGSAFAGLTEGSEWIQSFTSSA